MRIDLVSGAADEDSLWQDRHLVVAGRSAADVMEPSVPSELVDQREHERLVVELVVQAKEIPPFLQRSGVVARDLERGRVHRAFHHKREFARGELP